MSDLIIPDVSEFQGSIDWATLGASNPAAIVRVHNGYRADYRLTANVAGARAHCKWRGFYQYLPAAVDPRAAARAFMATIALQPGEVAILDLEEGAGDQRARRAAWLDEMSAAVEWTYSGLYYSRVHLPGVSVDWVAAYQPGEPSDAHRLWQYTSAASFPGIGGKVDSSRFHGTLADLIALSRGTSSAGSSIPNLPPVQAPQEWDQMASQAEVKAACKEAVVEALTEAVREGGLFEARLDAHDQFNNQNLENRLDAHITWLVDHDDATLGRQLAALNVNAIAVAVAAKIPGSDPAAIAKDVLAELGRQLTPPAPAAPTK